VHLVVSVLRDNILPQKENVLLVINVLDRNQLAVVVEANFVEELPVFNALRDLNVLIILPMHVIQRMEVLIVVGFASVHNVRMAKNGLIVFLHVQQQHVKILMWFVMLCVDLVVLVLLEKSCRQTEIVLQLINVHQLKRNVVLHHKNQGNLVIQLDVEKDIDVVQQLVNGYVLLAMEKHFHALVLKQDRLAKHVVFLHLYHLHDQIHLLINVQKVKNGEIVVLPVHQHALILTRSVVQCVARAVSVLVANF